ncbi:Uncharacterised protein [Mycobacteroides abscessus subsp. abscessus]|nr:Uncharacterised protein [Mycobacteroides abscessus subsp. abscessus]
MTMPIRPIHAVAFSEMWNFSAMMSFIHDSVSKKYSEKAAAPMAVRTGASRGRCSRLWAASSPVKCCSSQGHATMTIKAAKMPSTPHSTAGTVWPKTYSSQLGTSRNSPSVHMR